MHRLDCRSYSSPCFRTDAAGYILLRPDWPPLLEHLRAWGTWYVQTRHPYARLVALANLPDWNGDVRTSADLRDPQGILHLHLGSLGEALVRLESCPCCGSPGIVLVRDHEGHTVFELRAPPERQLADLAAIPAFFSAAGIPRGAPPPGSALFPTLPQSDLPSAPASLLPAFLRTCGDRKLPLLWRLLARGSDHRRIFVPERIGTDDGLLTVADSRSHSCQLVLPVCHRLVCERTATAALLHVVAVDDSLLLTLAAGDVPESCPDCDTALASLSPAFLQP